MKSCRAWITVVMVLTCTPLFGAELPVAHGNDFFESKIRPVLIARCYDCHGPDSAEEGKLRVDSLKALLTGGNTGPAIRPSNPEESLLIDAVNHGKLYQMPPKSKLPANEIADLTAWIKMGAPWPDSSAVPEPAAASTEVDKPAAKRDVIAPEQREFWAFQAPKFPALPEVRETAWVKSPIDPFILAGLEAKGLQPAKPAEKRALLRRATFDLTGLPPTPEEIQAFLQDQSPDAFAKVVDRLLASKRYGERWGRHWLDVARYADSNGMDENLAFVEAWRYRDYVINAFNDDLPYDQFLREQLAGDLMPQAGNQAETIRRQLGTAFLSLGPKMLAEDDPRKMEMDIVDEQVDTMGRTFLGLTLGCARCHDHKFDPIPSSDYYGLAGIFKSTKTMENFTVVAKWHERPVPNETEQHRYDEHQAKLAAKRLEIKGVRDQAAAAILAEARKRTGEYLLAADELRKSEENPVLMKPYLTEGEATPPNTLFVEAESFDRGNVLIDNSNYGAGIGVILNRGEIPNFAEYDIEIAAAGAFQIELRMAAAESRPVRLLLDGKLLRSQTAEATTGSWTPETQTWFATAAVELGAGKHTLRLERDGPFPHFDKFAFVPWPETDGPISKTAEQIAGERGLHGDFVIQWSKYLGNENIGPDGLLATWENLAKVPEWQSTNPLPDAPTEKLRETILSVTGPFALPQTSDALYSPDIRGRLETLKAEEAVQVAETPTLPVAMGVTEGTSQDVAVHYRGNYLTLGETVPRRFLRVLAGEEQPPFPAGVSGRLELANWLAHEDHPLTSRVMVNRIWRWHFGTGLVRSTDNFGRLGDQPVHQSLLDWLALDFIQSGWSMKSMHRRMMLSSTYQMSTTFDKHAFETDPENRLHWRMNRRRLEAEAIRDAILAVSGALDTTMGGSVLDCKPREYVAGTASVDKTNYDTPRRSVYLPVVRSALYDVFQAFDFADPSTLNGDRPTTTVAPQALFMMNSSIVRSETKRLAERLTGENLPDAERIQRLYEKSLGRPAAPAEVEHAVAFLDKCSEELAKGNVAEGERKQQAWQSLCRVILASSEFIHLE